MEKAELIIRSRAVFTCLEAQPRPGIVALGGGRILYVGDEAGASELTGGGAELYDAGEGLVMPGFHDAHMHFFIAALYRSPDVSFCGDLKSQEACARRLLPAAEKVPESDWLIGTGWRHGDWKDPSLPDRRSLDGLFPHRPVCLISGDLHGLWLNGKGLERLGLSRESRPIPGGIYGRFEDGELSGFIGEAAATVLMRRVLDLPESRLDRLYTDYMGHLNSLGLTSICDMSLTAAPGGDFVRDDVYSRLEDQGRLSLRVTMYPTLTEDLSRPLALREKHRGRLLRCGGAKQFYDGVSSCHTAWLTQDYTDAAFPGDRGRPTVPRERMRRLVLAAVESGLPVRVHTIGDRAIHEMAGHLLEAEALCGKRPGLRHCLEHLENFLPEDIERLARSGAVASVQPPHLTLDLDTVEPILGSERVKLMWPFRSLLDAGCPLAFGSDCPVVAPDPLKAVYTAVTRRDAVSLRPPEGWNPQERISLAEALRAYTLGSAMAAGADGYLGTLEPGKLADVAVLDINPFSLPPEALLEASARLTVLNGRPL